MMIIGCQKDGASGKFHITHNCTASNTYYRRYDKYGNIGKLIISPFINLYSDVLAKIT